jgi:XTP/dITP diphosphohydrolase
MDGIRKELGDLMLHLVFYSKIGSETGHFDIKDVLDGISEKLTERHPHIYGDVEVANAEDVTNNWEKIKLREKGRKSVLEGVPNSLPSMVKAYRMQEKTKGVGFDWENEEEVWDKVQEEIEELKVEVKSGDAVKKEHEFGDLLFSLINYARHINVNPEDALERTNKRFAKRFQYIEEQARKNGRPLKDMEFEEMDAFWKEAKMHE